MRFWDSSAIVPLLIDEEMSAPIHDVLRNDLAVCTWWGSRIECLSAIRRRERDGSVSAADLKGPLRLLDELASAWIEIQPSEEVRRGAERALAVHPLRAADALQLAAALAWRGTAGREAEFVCLDDRLCDAASREGFRVLPAEAG